MFKNKSKIGQAGIKFPDSVSCRVENNFMQVTGPKGSCSFSWHEDLDFSCQDNLIKIYPKITNKNISAIWGTMRSRLAGFIEGVVNGHKNTVNLLHVGYKAREFKSDGKDMIEFILGKSTKKQPPVSQDSNLYSAIVGASDKNVYQQDKALLGAAIAKIKSLRSEKYYKGRRISAGGDFVISRAVKQTK